MYFIGDLGCLSVHDSLHQLLSTEMISQNELDTYVLFHYLARLETQKSHQRYIHIIYRTYRRKKIVEIIKSHTHDLQDRSSLKSCVIGQDYKISKTLISTQSRSSKLVVKESDTLDHHRLSVPRRMKVRPKNHNHACEQRVSQLSRP